MPKLSHIQLMDIARFFDSRGETADHSDRPRAAKDTAICGSMLVEYAREAAKRNGVDVSDLSDLDILAIARRFDSEPDNEIEMLCAGEIWRFARAVMDEAGKRQTEADKSGTKNGQ